ADHAAAHNANFLLDNKVHAGIFPTSTIMKELNASLEREFQQNNIIRSFSNYQVSLNYEAIRAGKIDEAQLKQRIINYLQQQEGVAYAVDIADVQNTNIPE